MQFISPMFWDDAIDKIGARTPIGSALTSEEWSQLPLALRERAFFSSQIESVRFLQRAKDNIDDFMSRAVETLPDGRTALKTGSRQQFIKDLSDFAVSEGMGPLDASDAGTIKDVTSEGRLGLIFDVMTQGANDFAYWKQGMNPDVLDAYPAQRFIRERDVKEPRPVHQQNTDVVRLKSDLGFWMAMNDPSFGGFGVPWGPWGFGSGMGVDDVDRDTTEQMGLLEPGEKVQPVVKDFNDKLEASTRGLDDDMVALLKKSFGDQVEFADDSVKWKQAKPAPNVPEPTEETKKSPAPAALTLDDVLAKLDLAGSRIATARDMEKFVAELQESKPADVSRYVKFIKGAQPSGTLTDANISKVVQDFMSFIPQKTLDLLPKLQINVKAKDDSLGSYWQGVVNLNNDVLRYSDERARRTIFHELTHWLHMEGPQWYRDLIKKHFEERTAGERMKRLLPYGRDVRGFEDDWYDAYAGRVYNFATGDQGLEVPTRYMEWLTMPSDDMATMWNDPKFRETMKIVLQGLF